MKLHKSGVFQGGGCIIALAVFAFAVHGAERTWTGGGDGHTFADAANWDGAVASGDSLIIENPTADTTLYLTNDLGSAETPFKLFCITAQGEGSIRISGNPIEPTCASDQTNLVAKCAELITDFDIKLANYTSFRAFLLYAADYKTLTLNGSITAPGSGTKLRLITNRGTFNVNGDISIPNGGVNCRGGIETANMSGASAARWYFNGKITTANFNGNTSYLVNGEAHFRHAANEFGAFYLKNQNIYLDVAGALTPSTLVSPGGESSSNVGTLYLQGFDQTIDRLGITASIAGKSHTGHTISGAGATLTMASSVDNTTNDFRFIDSVNAAWAPLGDYSCTFRERAHTTSGRISVKRGTMAFLGATEFQNLTGIEIAAGAKFSLAETTTAAPLPKLSTIAIEDSSSSVIALRGGCTVTACVIVDGSPLAIGTYTGAGGTADHVVDWIEGTGVISAIPKERYVASEEWIAEHGYVQPADATFMTLNDPATNISDAVASAKAGVRILLLPGTHRLSSQVNVSTANLTIEAYDPSAGATVDAQGVCRHFYCTVADCVIKGLTLVNGKPAGSGGSVSISNTGAASIFDCTFRDNMTTNSEYWKGHGGAIYSASSRTFVSNCVFSANSAEKRDDSGKSGNTGGAICLWYSDTDTTENKIVDCAFSGNSATAGGAIYGRVCAEIRDCRFFDSHTATSQGGCCWVGKFSTIENCIFTGETSVTAGGNAGGCLYLSGTNTTVRGCLLTGLTQTGSGLISCSGTDILLDKCVITNNAIASAVFYRSGNQTTTTARQCLVADNTGVNGSTHCVVLIYRGVMRLENCTLKHSNFAASNWWSGDFLGTNVLANCIVQGMTLGSAQHHKNILTNCCVKTVPGGDLDSGVFADDPKFVDAAHGNYMLRRDSPCIDRGILLDWINADALDLAGNPRLVDADGNVGTAEALPDLGCYEFRSIRTGMMLIFR